MKNWEKTGLLEFEDKNGDGRVQYYDDTNPICCKAESYGWAGNEMVKVDKDIMVLANPEIAKLPNWVIALVVAVVSLQLFHGRWTPAGDLFCCFP